MSQMPDKIWLHKDTKYSTGDMVCGYQYDFVQGIEDEGGIENFVKYVPADAFIDKACDWIMNHHDEYSYLITVDYEDDTVGYEIVYETERMVEDFREASEQW